MSEWHVTEWSSQSGTGVIASDLGTLTIRRSDSLVDDFQVGELVAPVLEDFDGVIVARDVAPVAWRENAPAFEPPALADSVAEAVTALSRVLAPHVRMQLSHAKEDVVHFELHDIDWPPPVTPPLAAVQFEGVHYFKCPAFSESFVRAAAIPWARFRRERVKLLRYWSLAPDFAPDDVYVFRFEPRSFRETAGYVVAASIQVITNASELKRRV